ncbi:MAG: hypothetical protein ACPL7B_06000 [Candidatus Poribacteria bacterium]
MKRHFFVTFIGTVIFLLISNFALSDQSLLTLKIKSTPNLVGHWALDGKLKVS